MITMIEKKKILILFEGPHIAYSPTVIQLFDFLNKEFDVYIYLFYTSESQKLNIADKFIYFKHNTGVKQYISYIFYKILLILKDKIVINYNNVIKGKANQFFYRFKPLSKLIKEEKFDRIISVDIQNLLYCSLLNVECDFLSLELCTNEEMLKDVNQKIIKTVLIQSEVRYNYLFGKNNINRFFIQNAPIYYNVQIPNNRRGFIYSGTAWEPFGFFHCLEYIDKNENEIMFVQGALPSESSDKINAKYLHLKESGRLNFIANYIPNDKVVESILRFEIGFCFYNFDIEWINTFNYISAPSGKLFKYLAAGIPVICNDIIGFQFIRENSCGVLIKRLDNDSIRIATEQIRKNYKEYSQNCINYAKQVSFDRAIEPYLQYLRNQMESKSTNS